uniref:Bulb-type lectin domain-containing protein n=1 Tax=Nelumbo nucifera TaxID=4432 RepID=A0A822XV22_NELNU|nr:TPA_asm: hypothetical protein HUJ06_024402 [Nelumbo nucifera]
MVLTNADSSIVWSTDSTGNGFKVEFLNTGNLVLRDCHGNLSRQSFDSPTDTLLLFTVPNAGRADISLPDVH